MTSLRAEAEVSIVASLKYLVNHLVNHFFEMYGVEVHVGIKCSFGKLKLSICTCTCTCLIRALLLDLDGGGGGS